MIGDGRQELLDDVTVSAMDLEDVKAGVERAFARIDVGLYHALDIGVVHLYGYRAARFYWHRAGRIAAPGRLALFCVRVGERREAIPRRPGRDLAPGMSELYRAQRALFVQKIGDAPPGAHLFVVVNARAGVGLAREFFYGGFFHEHDAGAAHRKFSQMHQMPICGRTVLGQVLRHRRNNDAVARGHAAQCDGCEKVRCDLIRCGGCCHGSGGLSKTECRADRGQVD